MTLETYLELLDWTGRQLRTGAHGVIPQGLESILDRLHVSAESWLETVAQFRWFSTVLIRVFFWCKNLQIYKGGVALGSGS